MQVYRSLTDIPEGSFAEGTAIAIGKFDGVHRGHRALLDGIAAAAAQRGLEPLVFTFENNPLGYLRPDACPDPIMSPRQRIDALAAAGASSCLMVPFDAAIAEMPAGEFIERVLVEMLRVRYLCLGADFRFGRGGAGDAAMLARAGERFGFSVEVIGEVEDPGDPESGRVSSSRIREAILRGDVVAAGRMMGRPVSVRGEVVHGDARGRELGFPTANLGGGIEGLVPADGVYAGWAIVDGVRYGAAISVGVNLTFEPEGVPRVEAYLLDFSGDLYGKRIEVRFVERLRGMVAFAGVEALIERMHDDVRRTRELLSAAST